MSKPKKCEWCGKRKKLKRIIYYRNYEAADKKEGVHGWFCTECREQMPEA